MSVRVEPDGRRLVRVDVEVRGSAEEVWDAIATGPGISSWFVPTEIELDPDGRPSRLEVHFGSGMDSEAMVTAWDPPLRFVAESEDFVPGGPPVSTMWTVEPLNNNSCTVSVEHCLFADSDEYDLYIEGTEVGWPAFFRVLQIYMSDYRGQPCALVEAFANTRDSGSAWDRFKDALGLAGATTGQRVGVPKDAPPLAGTVDLVGGPSELLLKLEEPTTGAAHLFALPMGDEALLTIRLYLYGDDSDVVAARDAPVWQSWLEDRFRDDSA